MPYIVLDPTLAQAAPVVPFGPPDTLAKHPAGKSLSALRTRLILELGRRDDIPASVWNEWINDAYQDFYVSLDLPESRFSFPITMTIGQPMYLLPAQVNTVREISGIDPSQTSTNFTVGGALEKIDTDSYRKLPDRKWSPEVWFREQDMLVFWPTPDKPYQLSIDVEGSPLPLVNDTDYPILQDHWHEALFKAAKYRAWEGVQNDTKALITQNEMSRLISRKIGQDAADQDTEYPSMRPIYSRRDITFLRRRQHRVEPGDCN